MAAEPLLATAEPPPVLPPEVLPDYDAIVTEDGAPVDNIYSEKQQRLLTEPLYSSWPGPGEGRPFIAATNVGVFYGLLLPPIVPDAFLSADVKLPEDMSKKQHRSYFVWLYGKPPDVAIEVVSNNEGEELGRKLQIYARVGVPYYVVWDPDQLLGAERLHVFALHAGSYQKQASAWFPKVNLGLRIWHGAFEEWPDDWLRWCNAALEVLPTGAEAKQQAEQLAREAEQRASQAQRHADEAKHRADEAKHRADQAEHRADEAKDRAEQAEHRANEVEQEVAKARKRAERLAALLRAQGVEPPENGQ